MTNRKISGRITSGSILNGVKKPISLLDRIVRAGSSPGEVVLDPFNGSGTTGVAAVSLGRRYIGIDLDNEYLDLAHRRLKGL